MIFLFYFSLDHWNQAQNGLNLILNYKNLSFNNRDREEVFSFHVFKKK